MAEFPPLEVPANQGMSAGQCSECASRGEGRGESHGSSEGKEAKLQTVEKSFGQVLALVHEVNTHFEGFGIGWEGSAARGNHHCAFIFGGAA